MSGNSATMLYLLTFGLVVSICSAESDSFRENLHFSDAQIFDDDNNSSNNNNNIDDDDNNNNNNNNDNNMFDTHISDTDSNELIDGIARSLDTLDSFDNNENSDDDNRYETIHVVPSQEKIHTPRNKIRHHTRLLATQCQRKRICRYINPLNPYKWFWWKRRRICHYKEVCTGSG